MNAYESITTACAKAPDSMSTVANDVKTTPMIHQYLTIKEQYQDYILFYRMGDFYEMFFEDAATAARELEITLTSRNRNEEQPVPMCGVPVKAAEGYIGRLIDKGYKVAVCEQLEDSSKSKGLVHRDVVRVITPGMVVDNLLLDAGTHNFVVAICRNSEHIGISCLDVTTGTFRVAESDRESVIAEELMRIDPAELILSESAGDDDKFFAPGGRFAGRAVTRLPDRVFAYPDARKRLTGLFRTRSLEGFGCEGMHAGIGAAGALAYYVQETQKKEIRHLSGLETYFFENFMRIDNVGCRNLELLKNLSTGGRGGTLLDIIDGTVTAMGARLIKNWLRYPLIDRQLISQRLDAVEEIKRQSSFREEIRSLLKTVADVERLGGKIALGHATARDLVALKNTLFKLPDITASLKRFTVDLLKWDDALTAPLAEIADRIAAAIVDDPPPTVNEGGMIRHGYDGMLDELITISRDGKQFLAELESREKEQTGISTLKVRYNKVFGYYIEVSRGLARSVPAHYMRKQTLVNAERYITEELKNFEEKVLTAEERRGVLEYELFCRIRDAVVEKSDLVMACAGFIARLDCLAGLAHIADCNGYARPVISDNRTIHIEDGRHPVVEKLVAGERFVPNTVHMDHTNQQILIITGPNMAGKSTVLRQVALIVLMAQMGSFVPAGYAEVPVTDRIFTRVGALDNLSQGQSTFMVEMEETANIINNATSDSLVIMDEIGRGTSTYDGLSLAWAVAEYLHDLGGMGVKTLFATHYHELIDLAGIKKKVKNYNIAVKEWNEEIIFLHQLVPGGTNRSYGIQVARLAGIPDKVIRRARNVLANVENTGHVLGRRADKEAQTPRAAGAPVQLMLFKPPEQIIMERLREVDIATMTPLDALNVLSLLKDKAAGISARGTG
jgi:DNA mismatch repair protein MutS